TIGVDNETLPNLSGGDVNPNSIRLLPDQTGGFQVHNVILTDDLVVTVADSRVVTIDRDSVRSGSPNMNVSLDVSDVMTSGNKIYVLSNEEIYAYDGTSGSRLWTASGFSSFTKYGDHALCTPTKVGGASQPMRTIIDLDSGEQLTQIRLAFDFDGTVQRHIPSEPTVTHRDTLVIYNDRLVAGFKWPALSAE
ncbi:MAG: hypothetical protein ABEK02_01730, partial [Haloquadratum sp.]